MTTKHVPCPTPGKSAYDSRAAAERAMGTFWHKMRNESAPTRSYRCPCGSWHLSSKPRRKRSNHA